MNAREAEKIVQARVPVDSIIQWIENPPIRAYNADPAEWYYFSVMPREVLWVGGDPYVVVNKQTGQLVDVGRLGE